MTLPFIIYKLDDGWYFLNVSVKTNNTYWIDWNEIHIETDSTFNLTDNFNILCVNDNKLCYYNTNDKTIKDLTHLHLSLCVDGIKNVDDLHKLQEKYEHKHYYFE